MNGEFKGKTALITGGTKGLGLAFARLLAREGASLLLGYRSDREGAERATKELGALTRCRALECDLSEGEGAAKLWDETGRALEGAPLHFYVHNAAATAFKPLLEIQPHHVDKTFALTVKSLVAGMQRALPLMREGGAVVTVSGMDTLKAVPRHGLLGAAKAALETLTSYYAHELGPRGIRVNGVNPGFLRTDSTRKYLGPAFDKVSSAFAASLPLKLQAELDEVAQAMLFLCSERSRWIVGQTITVDGGQDFALPLP